MNFEIKEMSAFLTDGFLRWQSPRVEEKTCLKVIQGLATSVTGSIAKILIERPILRMEPDFKHLLVSLRGTPALNLNSVKSDDKSRSVLTVMAVNENRSLTRIF